MMNFLKIKGLIMSFICRNICNSSVIKKYLIMQEFTLGIIRYFFMVEYPYNYEMI